MTGCKNVGKYEIDKTDKLFACRHTLIPPRGFTVAGIFGTCGQWMDGFGLIIMR